MLKHFLMKKEPKGGMLKTSVEMFKDGFVGGVAKCFFHN